MSSRSRLLPRFYARDNAREPRLESFRLRWTVSGVSEIIGAFAVADAADKACEVIVDGVDRSRLRHAQPMLHLGEDLFDRIEE